MMWEGLSPPYRTIVVDPPWRYKRTAGLTTKGHRPSTAQAHYSTMSNEQIAALPIEELAAEQAHLYLWVTVPRLFGEHDRQELPPIAFLKQWGFEWKQMLTWVKTGQMGMGWYFRNHAEHVLFGIRGSLPVATRDLSNVVVAPRRRHSEKPGAMYDLIERVSPGPYVELFARQPRLGWDSWGWGYETNEGPPESASSGEQSPGALSLVGRDLPTATITKGGGGP